MHSYFENFDDLILHINAETLDALYSKFTSVKTRAEKNVLILFAKEYFISTSLLWNFNWLLIWNLF